MQHLEFAGWPCVGCSESLLHRIWQNVKNAARRLVEILNQPGVPNEAFSF
jgi:hypothetical protein